MEAKSEWSKQGGKAWEKIIHYEIEKEEGDKRYLCNQACNTFPEKRTKDKSKVTCRNCLHKLNEKNIEKKPGIERQEQRMQKGSINQEDLNFLRRKINVA